MAADYVPFLSTAGVPLRPTSRQSRLSALVEDLQQNDQETHYHLPVKDINKTKKHLFKFKVRQIAAYR